MGRKVLEQQQIGGLETCPRKIFQVVFLFGDVMPDQASQLVDGDAEGASRFGF